MFQFSTGIFILLSFTSYNNGFLIGQGRSNTVGLLLSSWTPPMKGKELQNKQTKSQFHKDKFHRKGDISIWKITTLFWNMKSSVKKGIWLKRAEVITWASPKRDAKKKKEGGNSPPQSPGEAQDWMGTRYPGGKTPGLIQRNKLSDNTSLTKGFSLSNGRHT